MISIVSTEEFEALEDNELLGTAPKMNSSKVVFKGKGNILFCEPGVTLQSTTLEFNGDNGLIVLGKSSHVYRLAVSVNNNCTFAAGRDNYFNGQLHAVVSEERMIFVGDDCLFSFGVWLRTADPHLVYDCDSRKRINLSKDVVIGDHVWIGQDALILKGTVIGSGSILGGRAVVAGKRIPSNASWAGNPVKSVRDGVFWDNPCVHSWTEDKTRESMDFKGTPCIYEAGAKTLDAKELSETISGFASAVERLDYLLSFGYGKGEVNRLAIAVSQAKVSSSAAEDSRKKKPLFSGLRSK